MLLVASCGQAETDPLAPLEPSESGPQIRSGADDGQAVGLDQRGITGSNILDRLSGQTSDQGSADALTAVANTTITARSEPHLDAPEVATFELDPTYPLYFLALPTYAQYEAQADQEWLEVLLPVRPNGTTGWIPADDVTLYQNRFRIEIDVSDHALTLRERDQTVFTTKVGIGTGDTPTPIGSFYTTVLYDVPDPNGPYGPYAFALSGFSEVLTTFNGGEGLIGIHGTNDPGSLGTDVSHGCIRLPNDLITQMADLVPLGTPVTIVP